MLQDLRDNKCKNYDKVCFKIIDFGHMNIRFVLWMYKISMKQSWTHFFWMLKIIWFMSLKYDKHKIVASVYLIIKYITAIISRKEKTAVLSQYTFTSWMKMLNSYILNIHSHVQWGVRAWTVFGNTAERCFNSILGTTHYRNQDMKKECTWSNRM